MKELTCFLISPIGDKDSEVRKNADDLLELIIEPALEKYAFNIIRADKLSTVSSITNDIINHVQNSDLCIIDLTGQNSNVMYELGRRHESGKPFILLAKESEKLPFDINTIRTVFYNLTSPKEVRDTVKVIQSFLEKQIENGFAPKSSGESLTSISDTLKRIERSIEGIKLMKSQTYEPINVSELDILKSLTPKEAFSLSLKENNLGVAESLLPSIKQITSLDNYFDNYIEPLAAKGSLVAKDIIEENFDYIYNLSIERQVEAIGSLVNCYSLHDMESIGYGFLMEYLDKLNEMEIEPKILANILNQKQKLLFGIPNIELAIETGKKVIELNPTEPTFYYNLSTCYLSNKDIDNACKMIDQCLIVSDELKLDDDHLSKAIDIYRLKGNKNKVDELFEKLKVVNPYKYKLKKLQ
jgi:tetratricopeptide (TPR) repeat protein